MSRSASDPTTVVIRFNGEPCELPEGATVAEALRRFELQDKPVAVELNLEVVPRAQRDSTFLRGGDRLEVVSLIGGG